MRLGVLGGTFDPPHYGHLMLAEVARDQLALERVLWVPAADPPHKQNQIIESAQHRIAMLELALDSNAAFVLSRADVDRPGPHYTVDLLALLSGEYPGAELYFLMGGDSLRDLASWRDPARIVEQCQLVVMPRPKQVIDMDALDNVIPGLRQRVTFIDSPLVDLSASQIVRRVQQGRSIRYLTPPAIIEYINRHQLYLSEERV